MEHSPPRSVAHRLQQSGHAKDHADSDRQKKRRGNQRQTRFDAE